MSTRKQYDDELDRIMSCLAESVTQMSDEQVKQEYGHEPESSAKAILKAALKDFDQAKLREARAKYELATKDLAQRSYNLPSTAPERRSLLSAFLSQRPDMRSAFTAQHREFEDLTDSDVESFLKQLADLGMI